MNSNERTSPITCPNCGNDNPTGSTFCNKCGVPLAFRIVETDSSDEDGVIYCSGCGAANPAGARFCDNCGAVIRRNDWEIAVKGRDAREVQQVAQSLANTVTKATTESSGKIKVLFLAANPIDTVPLRLDEEIRTITTKIRASDYRDSIELVSAWAIRADDLLQLLNEHKPHIVHFSGHGDSGGEIILLDSNGISKPVNKAALGFLFSTLKDNIRVVVLNACYSRVQAEAISQVVECVVGMGQQIGDRSLLILDKLFSTGTAEYSNADDSCLVSRYRYRDSKVCRQSA